MLSFYISLAGPLIWDQEHRTGRRRSQDHIKGRGGRKEDKRQRVSCGRSYKRKL